MQDAHAFDGCETFFKYIKWKECISRKFEAIFIEDTIGRSFCLEWLGVRVLFWKELLEQGAEKCEPGWESQKLCDRC